MTRGRPSAGIAKFIYILRHGDSETVEALTRNVNRFSLLARLINKEPAANDELDRIATELDADPERRLEYLRELEERYSPGGKAPRKKCETSTEKESVTSSANWHKEQPLRTPAKWRVESDAGRWGTHIAIILLQLPFVYNAATQTPGNAEIVIGLDYRARPN